MSTCPKERMPSDTALRFGLVLPHFGADPQVSGVLEAAQQAERYGFHSLWVRDRLAAGAPHGLLLEAGGITFFEPLLTLAAVAAVTERITLGTAVLLPNRHPLRLMQEVGTLWRLSGGRLALGLGLGVGPKNFEPLGLDYSKRVKLFENTVDALRGVTSGFDEVEIDPAPGEGLSLYYGGVSRAAVRRAFQCTDGWIAGRLPVTPSGSGWNWRAGMKSRWDASWTLPACPSRWSTPAMAVISKSPARRWGCWPEAPRGPATG